MPLCCRIALLCMLLMLSTVAAAPSRAADAIPLRLIVPAYFYPAEKGLAQWKRLIDSSEKAPLVAIVNPDSGPGKRIDPSYTQLFELSRGRPITLIGYVTFSYAKRPISAIKADVDSWLQFYPEVQGIFFDEQPSGVEHVAFAAECFAYARSRIDRAAVVTNPGIPCAREYLAGRDCPTACLFEHETGFDTLQFPEWISRVPRERIYTLHYSVKGVPQMQKFLEAAVSKGAGSVYITDRLMPNPWDGLPAYWDDQVDAVARLNAQQRKSPNR